MAARKKPDGPVWGPSQEQALTHLERLFAGAVVVDTETTGLLSPGHDVKKPYGDQVVEVTALHFPSGEQLFHSYVRPVMAFHKDAHRILARARFDFEAARRASAWNEVFPALLASIYPRLDTASIEAHREYVRERREAALRRLVVLSDSRARVRSDYVGDRIEREMLALIDSEGYEPQAYDEVTPRPLLAWNSSFDNRLIRQTSGVFRFREMLTGVTREPLIIGLQPADPPEWRQIRRRLDKEAKRVLEADAQTKGQVEEDAPVLTAEDKKVAWLESVLARMHFDQVVYHREPPRRVKKHCYQVMRGAVRQTYGLAGWVDAMPLYGALRGASRRTAQLKAGAREGLGYVDAPTEDTLFSFEEALEHERVVAEGRQAHGATSDCRMLIEIFRRLGRDLLGRSA